MEKLLPYTTADYAGKFNLKRAEKSLIQLAIKQTDGDLDKMSKLLKIEKIDLLVALVRHFNVSVSLTSPVPSPKKPRKAS